VTGGDFRILGRAARSGVIYDIVAGCARKAGVLARGNPYLVPLPAAAVTLNTSSRELRAEDTDHIPLIVIAPFTAVIRNALVGFVLNGKGKNRRSMVYQILYVAHIPVRQLVEFGRVYLTA